MWYHKLIMQNTIKCKKCGEEIEISEAFAHQIEEEIRTSMKKEHAKDLEEVKLDAEKTALAKIQKDFDFQLKALQKEKEEEKERNLKLLKQLVGLNDEMRKLQRKDEERDLEFKKNLAAEEEKIRLDASKKAEEENRLKIKEMELKNAELMKAVEEMRRKANQGSQQTQGEVQELDLEERLRKLFPTDEITEVKKGELGADIRHTVKTERGTICGVILWESKRTKTWTEGWIAKLKEDARKDKAPLAALVSEVLPADLKSEIWLRNGVWVTNFHNLESLAILLRKNLVDVARVKNVALNKQTKAEELYDYVTSHEFTQQLERTIEIYLDMKNQITKERVSLERSLKQREVQVDRLLTGVSGIYGSMQGIAGPALPSIKQLNSGVDEEGD